MLKVQIFIVKSKSVHENIPEGASPLRAPRHRGTVSKWQAGCGVTVAAKEANRQTPVLTNRNDIRGYRNMDK